MNTVYPDRHHPIYMLQDALENEGVFATFHRDEQSKDLWGLEINGRMVIWLIDIRWQHEKDAHEESVYALQKEGALICCAQKPDAEYFNAKWLPLAPSPGYAPPEKPASPIVDLAFVGYVRDRQREQLLLDLNAKFSLSASQGMFGQAAVSSYHQARLGINIPTRYGDPLAYDSANMRCFEVLATGTPLVTPYEDYLAELGIIDGQTAFTYRNQQDCLETVRRALSGDLDKVSQAALDLVQKRHTYTHRAGQVLEWLS